MKCKRCLTDAEVIDCYYMMDYGIRVSTSFCGPCNETFGTMLNKLFVGTWIMTTDF